MSRRSLRRRPAMHEDEADELARHAAGGDADAFAALCHGLHQDVWRYCWSLTGDRHLADEATQETFLRATRSIRGFRGDAPVRVWFIVLARRSVGGLLQAARRVPVPSEPTTRPMPSTTVKDGTGAVDVATLVAGLPVESRQAFVLTQMLGLSYADAAAALDCAVGTIRSRVFRARATLVDAWNIEDDEPEEVCR